MCNITDNFMEEELFYQQLKQQREYQMWYEYQQQKEEEDRVWAAQAQQYFDDLELMETI